MIVKMPFVACHLVLLVALCSQIFPVHGLGAICTSYARKDQPCNVQAGRCCNTKVGELYCMSAFITWLDKTRPDRKIISVFPGKLDKCKSLAGAIAFGPRGPSVTSNAFSLLEAFHDDESVSNRRSLPVTEPAEEPAEEPAVALTHNLRCGVTEKEAALFGANSCLDASDCTDAKQCWDVDAPNPSTCITRYSDPVETECPPGQFCFGRGAMTTCAPVAGPPVNSAAAYEALGCSTADVAAGNVQLFDNDASAKRIDLAVAEAIRNEAPFYEVARSVTGGAGKTFEDKPPSTTIFLALGSPGCEANCEDAVYGSCGFFGNSTSPRVWSVFGNGCKILKAPPVTPADQAIYKNPEIKLFQCPLCAYITKVRVQATCKVVAIKSITCSDGSTIQTNMSSQGVAIPVKSTSFFAAGFVAASVEFRPLRGPSADNFPAAVSISFASPDSTAFQVLTAPRITCIDKAQPGSVVLNTTCAAQERIVGVKVRRPFDGGGVDTLEFLCGTANAIYKIRNRQFSKCLDAGQFDVEGDLVTGGPAQLTDCITRAEATPNSWRYFQVGSKGIIVSRQTFTSGDRLQCLDINFSKSFLWPQSRGFQGYLVYHNECNNSLSQRWVWKYVSDGTENLRYYSVANRANGFCLMAWYPRSAPQTLALGVAPCVYAEQFLASQFTFLTL